MISLKRLPKFVPRDYQVAGINQIINNPSSGLLWSPGLGKTGSLAYAFLKLKAAGTVDKLYIIAPPAVAALVWPDIKTDFRDFENLDIVYCHGPKKQKLIELDADVYIITYNSLKFLLDNKSLIGPKDMIVFDESTKIKDTGSKRFKLLRKLLPCFSRRVILTGSFTTNGMQDLFGQVYAMDNGESLGKYITHFRNAYFNRKFDGWGYELMPGMEPVILGKIKPMVNQLSGDHILNLPGTIYKEIKVELPPAARKVYNELKRDAISVLEAGIDAGSGLDAMDGYGGSKVVTVGSAAHLSGKLLQVASGGVYSSSHDVDGADRDIPPERITTQLHNEKTKAVVDLVEQLGGESLIIMYQTRHDLERLTKAFPKAPIMSGMTPKVLKKTVDAWNAGELDVILAHPMSIGHGLNFQHNQRGRSICWYSPNFDLELFQQANARLARSGQKQVVFVYTIVANRTLDSHVVGVLAGKLNSQQTILDFLKQQ